MTITAKLPEGVTIPPMPSYFAVETRVALPTPKLDRVIEKLEYDYFNGEGPKVPGLAEALKEVREILTHIALRR